MLNKFFVCLSLAAFLIASTPAAEGDPEIEVQLESQDIFMGESVRYIVRVNNLKTAVAPDLSGFDTDFAVKSQGDQSQNQVSMNYVNGRVFQRTVYAHIYQYQLTPKRAGMLTVPAPFILAEGQKISGVPAQLRVRAQEKQDLVIFEIVPGKPRVYPTQPFDVTLKVLVKPMPNGDTRDPLSLIDPIHLTIDWLKSPEGLTSSDLQKWLNTFLDQTGHAHGFTLEGVTVDEPFSLFERRNAVLSLYTGREKRAGLDGASINYFVYELKRTFTPQKTGKFTFGPASLKGSFVEGLAGKRYSTRPLVLTAPATTVEVREVPAPVPATFCGGLGNFKVDVSANPVELRVGDPLTLKIAFERQKGSGGLEMIFAPDISVNEQVSADFEIIDKAPTGEVSGEKKVFTYGLRPKRAGAKISALAISLFDVDAEKFNEMTTDPIDLKVTQSSQVGGGDIVSAAPKQKPLEIRNRQGGVFQNFTDMSALQDQSTDPAVFGVLAILSWMFSGAVCFLVLRGRRRASDAAWQRRQRARPEAAQMLNEARTALTRNDALAAAKAGRSAIAGFIGNMLDLPSAGMTAHEAGVALTGAGVSEVSRKQAAGLLENLEAIEYAPSGGQNIAALLDSAEKMLPQLQQELDK